MINDVFYYCPCPTGLPAVEFVTESKKIQIFLGLEGTKPRNLTTSGSIPPHNCARVATNPSVGHELLHSADRSILGFPGDELTAFKFRNSCLGNSMFSNSSNNNQLRPRVTNNIILT